MITWLYALASAACWITASRALFRFWRRHDSLQWAGKCPNPNHWSYYRQQSMTHAGRCCLGKTRQSWSLPAVAALAMAAGLFWPLMVLAALVIWRAPRSQSELQARIAELERELDVKS